MWKFRKGGRSAPQGKNEVSNTIREQRGMANINGTVIQIASLFNYAKNGVIYLTIAVFLGGIVGWFIRRRNKQGLSAVHLIWLCVCALFSTALSSYCTITDENWKYLTSVCVRLWARRTPLKCFSLIEVDLSLETHNKVASGWAGLPGSTAMDTC